MFSLVSLPFLAGFIIFSVALFTGEDIAVSKILVTESLQSKGYDDTVLTRSIHDNLREINDSAASSLVSLDREPSRVQQSLQEVHQGWMVEIQQLVAASRRLLGLTPFLVNGEVVEEGEELVVTLRVFSQASNAGQCTVRKRGTDIDGLMREASLEASECINPYVVALYHRKIEEANARWDFPETKRVADVFLKTQPADDDYLINSLIGRMHMIKAERDSDLTPEQKEAEYDRAIELLNGALLQNPDFAIPYLNLAVIHQVRGKTSEAEKYFRQAAQMDPSSRLIRVLWSDFLYAQGRLDEAVVQFVAAVEIEKHNPALRNRLGQLYVEMGRKDLASKQFKMAMRMDPRDRNYLSNWRDSVAVGQ
jgi:tetratricopeptide (TPR) repeat protein